LGKAHLQRIFVPAAERLLKGCDKKMTQYKAEHIVGSQQNTAAAMQVFNVRRVSLGLQLGSA
jgi:hypothetical protein